ncbi:hypothetical protein GA0070560_105198 [Micromonospora halophytica]|uniref:Uncharacterized protein n=1 Tax=Micromonospora halophytica TaxID=47864 RepID=A0A1C5HPV4_9ACTN|nr:hypothetical protein GA0070560_105198 [Micromonospora halophytica]
MPARPPGAGDTGTEARPEPARPTEAVPAAPGWRGGTDAEARPVGAPPEPTEARPAGAGPSFEPGTWARARGELGSPYEFIPHTLPVAVGRGGAATGLP